MTHPLAHPAHAPAPPCRTEALDLFEGEARFRTEVHTSHTLYRAHDAFLPKTVTIVVDVAPAGSKAYERVAELFVDLGTMCNTSSKGWVETDALAIGKGRPAQTYKIEVRSSTISVVFCDHILSL